MRTLITSREVAMRLRLTEADVAVAVERGEIPFVKVADEVRFDFQDVVSKLKEQTDVAKRQ